MGLDPDIYLNINGNLDPDIGPGLHIDPGGDLILMITLGGLSFSQDYLQAPRGTTLQLPPD